MIPGVKYVLQGVCLEMEETKTKKNQKSTDETIVPQRVLEPGMVAPRGPYRTHLRT